MSQAAAVALGAIAGGTVFLGLPVARMHGLPKSVQGFLNAFATGILVFLLWDILTHAAGPVEAAISQGQRGPFAAMAVIFAVGIGAGLDQPVVHRPRPMREGPVQHGRVEADRALRCGARASSPDTRSA